MNSIKGIADAIFGVNPSPKELSLDEMLRYRAKSKEMLQNRIKSGTRRKSGGKVTTEDNGNPCPKCDVSNWNEFPDGRKYCLECGAVMEHFESVKRPALSDLYTLINTIKLKC